MKPYFSSESVTIYHADCRDVLSELLNENDTILTDPPYGLSWSTHPASTVTWSGFVNDTGELDLRFVLELQNRVIVFGAYNFIRQLPIKGRWICWDKRCNEKADRMLGSPFELAWVNNSSGFDRMYRIQHGGVVNANGGPRLHPTEKPIELMRRIISDYGCKGRVVDPFCGSGTTLRAAQLAGMQSVGIEIDEQYCEVAANRCTELMQTGMLA